MCSTGPVHLASHTCRAAPLMLKSDRLGGKRKRPGPHDETRGASERRTAENCLSGPVGPEGEGGDP
jgi:hypothetical protein